MISWLVSRIVQRAYRQANALDLDRLTRAFAPDAVFEFQGATPLGGERFGPAGVRAWFEQVATEFGRLQLTAHNVAVSGPAWDLKVIVRFTDRYHLIGDHTLENSGFQYLRLRWGKVKEDRILVNLDVVRQAMELVKRAQIS